MNIDGFITESEGYFNQKYNPYQKKYVRGWLAKINEKEIAYVFAEVLKILPISFKSLPGIHELEKALRVVKKERYAEVYEQSKTIYDVNKKADSGLIADMIDKLVSKTEK